MPVGPPVRPRRLDERAYERALRQAILDPMVGDFNGHLAGARIEADRVRQAIQMLRDQERVLIIQGEDAAAKHLRKVKAYHDRRFSKAMGRYFNISTDLLSDFRVKPLMEEAIATNVDLIKTIPQRYANGLDRRITEIQLKGPLDQKALRTVLRDEYDSSGYNLRRLTRDQTNKFTGQLNEVRQTDLGIEKYKWQSSEDERVRPSHSTNNGKEFLWSAAPATGHPGNAILCRCVALPVF